MSDHLQSFLARIPNMPTSKIVWYLAITDRIAAAVSETALTAETQEVNTALAMLATELDARIPVPKRSP